MWIRAILTLCCFIFHWMQDIIPRFTLFNNNNAESICSLFTVLCNYYIHQEPGKIRRVHFFTTAVSSNFYSTNSSQSPFNGISINLLNGFKNSLTPMWISEILMWTLKLCSRCTQFDRISSVSMSCFLVSHTFSPPVKSRLSLMKLMGLQKRLLTQDFTIKSLRSVPC